VPRDLPLPESNVFRWVEEETQAELLPGARMSVLPGGAVLRHYLLEFALGDGRFAGAQRWVMRADGATKLGLGLKRAQEFAVQRALFIAGMKVAEPLFMCCDESVFGAPFFVMRCLPGEALGASIVAHGENRSLAEELAGELARLHGLELRRALHFLPLAPGDAAEARIVELETLLRQDDDPHPVAEWALRWLKRHKPEPVPPVLCHGDFRTGNYLVADGKLSGVLDWDFAGWSDPDEDIAWFCAKAWRFGVFAREAGGIASRESFYRAYEAIAGRAIDPRRVHYWEIMAALRWLVIALKQRDRFLRQGERSLDLALTGRRPAECELEILMLTEGSV
jgi:aminoglycoside phosphotransferase (APT) family kinase protein